MNDIQLFNGDCVEVMKEIPDKSVDLVLCDLPYGTTQNEWDSIIPLDKLWAQYKRIIRDCGIIVLFAQTPFDKILGASNILMLKYEWVWEKEQGTGYLNAKKMPMKSHENILVFYENASEKFSTTDLYLESREYLISEKNKAKLKCNDIVSITGSYMGSHYFTRGSQFIIPTKDKYKLLQGTGFFKKPYEELEDMYYKEINAYRIAYKKHNTFNPQMRLGNKPYVAKMGNQTSNYGKSIRPITISNGERYPLDVLKFKRDKERIHPTQKPVALLEYLIKTYSNEGETILDNTMGSGSTGVACVNTNRKFMGIELDNNYFNIAQKRINDAIQAKRQLLF